MGQILMHQITEVQLKLMIESTIREVLADLFLTGQPIASNIQVEATSDYLTRKQAADYLQISLPTLHAHTQKGVIKAMRLGKQIRYLRKNLDAAFESSSRNKRYYKQSYK